MLRSLFLVTNMPQHKTTEKVKPVCVFFYLLYFTWKCIRVQEADVEVEVRFTISTCSWWNVSPISRSLRPICTSTLTPACSWGLAAILSFSSPPSSSSPSSSICLPPRSSMGSNWAGKCERNPALPKSKTWSFFKLQLLLNFKIPNQMPSRSYQRFLNKRRVVSL